MKLKQKEAFVYDVLKNLAVSKTFLGVIICEIALMVSSLSSLFLNSYLEYSSNATINFVITIFLCLLSVTYSLLNSICYINIYSFFKGKSDKLYGFKHLYKIQFWGMIIIASCSIIFRSLKTGFDFYILGVVLMMLCIIFTIFFLIYTKLIKNAIDCAHYASQRFISGSIGGGLGIYIILLFISQAYSIISCFFNDVLQFSLDSYSYSFRLDVFLTQIPSIIALISSVLCLGLLNEFRKAINIK